MGWAGTPVAFEHHRPCWVAPAVRWQRLYPASHVTPTRLPPVLRQRILCWRAGIQPQTAECIVIGEITARDLIVVLNKIGAWRLAAAAFCIQHIVFGGAWSTPSHSIPAPAWGGHHAKLLTRDELSRIRPQRVMSSALPSCGAGAHADTMPSQFGPNTHHPRLALRCRPPQTYTEVQTTPNYI